MSQLGQIVESLEELLEAGPTFKAAKAKVLDRLSRIGWETKPNLKVPVAISPDGDVALFFKPQAIYMDSARGGKSYRLTNARSYSNKVKELSEAPDAKFKAWADVASEGNIGREEWLDPLPKPAPRGARKARTVKGGGQPPRTKAAVSKAAAVSQQTGPAADPKAADRAARRQQQSYLEKAYSQRTTEGAQSISAIERMGNILARAATDLGSAKLELERAIAKADAGSLRTAESRIQEFERGAGLLLRAMKAAHRDAKAAVSKAQADVKRKAKELA